MQTFSKLLVAQQCRRILTKISRQGSCKVAQLQPVRTLWTLSDQYFESVASGNLGGFDKALNDDDDDDGGGGGDDEDDKQAAAKHELLHNDAM